MTVTTAFSIYSMHVLTALTFLWITFVSGDAIFGAADTARSR